MFPSWNSDLDGLADADHCDESDTDSRHLLSDHLPCSIFSCVNKFPSNQLHKLLLHLLDSIAGFSTVAHLNHLIQITVYIN